MKIKNLKKALQEGFTLIELLVVVAIIAVIGSGIAVTYRSLDDQAKTSMEMSDISALKKVIKHWMHLRDYQLPNNLDLLVAQDGSDHEGRWGHPPYQAHPAPEVVISNLSAAGLTTGYVHVDGASIANDSTFEDTGSNNVDTANTIRRIYFNGASVSLDIDEFFATGQDAAALAHDYTTGPFTWAGAEGAISVSWPSAGYASYYISQYSDLQGASLADDLAFIHPSYGSVADEVISNIGLDPSEIADPTLDTAVELADGKRYYLVAMGIGRFASIYTGRSVRADGPPKGKRASGGQYYTRYLTVFKVPLEPYRNHGHSVTEGPQLVDVISHAGYSVAFLEDWLQQEKDNAGADY